MDWYQVGTITLAVLALAVVSAINANGIRSLIASLQASMDTFRSEAAADRRAMQAATDEHRMEMQRLAERQARVEGAGD